MTPQKRYGFAVDVGTTKLAAYLVDLNKGSVVATASMMNPQIPYGEDVISRITYVMKDRKKMNELQTIVVDGVNILLSDGRTTPSGCRELCSRRDTTTRALVLEQRNLGRNPNRACYTFY